MEAGTRRGEFGAQKRWKFHVNLLTCAHVDAVKRRRCGWVEKEVRLKCAGKRGENTTPRRVGRFCMALN